MWRGGGKGKLSEENKEVGTIGGWLVRCGWLSFLRGPRGGKPLKLSDYREGFASQQ